MKILPVLAATAFLVAGAAHAQQPTPEQQLVQENIAQTIGTLSLQNIQLRVSLRIAQEAEARERAAAQAARTNLEAARTELRKRRPE